MKFYNQDSKEALEFFHTNKDKGLSELEVEKRKNIYGLNELKTKKKINPLMIFLRQFKSFIIYILIFAVLISILVKEYIDSGVILAILLFNAFFGFIQEYRAEKSIEALRKLSGYQARVLREGKVKVVDTKELVPGDIIILEEGDKIPADARIVENIGLGVLESSLTGESVPVLKVEKVLDGELTIADRKNMLFSGTLVTKGRGKAVITGTGMKTEIGKIAELMSEVEKEITPLQKKLESFGKWVGAGVILISIFVFVTGVVREGLVGLLVSGQYLSFIVESKDWFLTAIALAVAAVPEGLPAIITISLALGVRKMLKRNALVRRLPSVETLGETTVICSDKTGTLTRNEMTVRKVYTNLKDIEVSGRGYELDGKISCSSGHITKNDFLIFKIGVLCNNASLDVERKDGKDGKNARVIDDKDVKIIGDKNVKIIGDKNVKIIGDPTEAALLKQE